MKKDDRPHTVDGWVKETLAYYNGVLDRLQDHRNLEARRETTGAEETKARD